jgi:hypothetical protein
MHHFFKNKLIARKWAHNFDKIINKKTDTWDYQWAYTCIKNNASSITPLQNLVSNIGIVGTHSNNAQSLFHELPIQNIDVDAVSKNLIPKHQSHELDMEIYKIEGYLWHDPYWKKIGRFIKHMLRHVTTACSFQRLK